LADELKGALLADDGAKALYFQLNGSVLAGDVEVHAAHLGKARGEFFDVVHGIVGGVAARI
jgi:hypothetical protein